MSTVRAIRIDTERTVSVVDLGADVLAGLYREIGCHTVDVVQLAREDDIELDMWVDDDGAFRSTINVLASVVADDLTPRDLQPYFYGTAVFAASNSDGATVSLADAKIAAILAVARNFGATVPTVG